MDLVTDSPAEWSRLITDNFISLSVNDVDDGFTGSLRSCDLGGAIRLSMAGTHRCRVRRETRGIRADASDDLLLLTPLTGTVRVRQEDSETSIAPGAVSIHVADRPYDLRCDRSCSVIVLQAPRRLVPSPALVSPERRRVAASGAMAGIYRAFVTETLAAADQLGDRERDELGATAAGLAVSLLSASPPSEAGRPDTLLTMSQSFIRSRLGDPDLTPAVVAAAHQVSLRSLQSAFANAGTSPAAYIRSERSRRSRLLLVDRRYASWSIAQIAREVGYDDTNVFIRAFKRDNEHTPGAWRAANTDPRARRSAADRRRPRPPRGC